MDENSGGKAGRQELVFGKYGGMADGASGDGDGGIAKNGWHRSIRSLMMKACASVKRRDGALVARSQ